MTRAEPAVMRARLDDGGIVLLVGARRAVHFSACGSSVSCARVSSRTSPSPGRSPRPCRRARRRRDRPALAHDEADHALALDGVEAEVPGERGDRGARALERGDDVALDRAPEAGDVDAVVGHPGAAAEVAHQRGERRPTRAGRSASARAASSARRSRRRRARGRTDRAARPRSRRRSPRPAPCGRRRPRRPGCWRPRPTSPRSPRGRPAGWRRRASRGRSAAGSSPTTSGRRRRSAGWCRGRPPGSRASVKTDRLRLRDPGRRRAALDAARAVEVRVRPPGAQVLGSGRPTACRRRRR